MKAFYALLLGCLVCLNAQAATQSTTQKGKPSMVKLHTNHGIITLQLDAEKLNIMAKPFDFSTEQPVLTLPTIFREDQYLHVNNIVNTLLHLFSVPKEFQRRRNVGAEPYSPLRRLLR